MADYILLQDGSGQITLQDGSGQILLQSDGAAAAVEHTSGFLGRTLAGTQYRRRPQLLWHEDEGLSTVQDTGGSIQVVRPLDSWSLARATRFNYWNTAQDFSFVEEQPEPSTTPQFLVRTPFKPFGRNPYLQHRDWFTTVEPLDLPPWRAIVPLKGLGRNPDLRHQDWDSFVEAQPEPATLAPFFVTRSLRGLGRNPYNLNTAQDFSFTPAPEADIFTPFLIHLPLAARLNVRAAMLNMARSAQDEDAPPVVPDTAVNWKWNRKRRR